MKLLVLATTFGTAGLMLAQTKVPVATVSSVSPITVQGVEAPSYGSTAWPVTEGDVIRTSSSPAEVRLKDGTRIYVPPTSRYVVNSAVPSSNPRADLRVRAVAGAPDMSSIRTQKAGTGAVLTMLDGGSMVLSDSKFQEFAAAASSEPRKALGDTPATIDLAALANTYGPNNPIISVLSTAMNTPGITITTNPATPGVFTITLPGGQGTIVVNGLVNVTVTTPTGGTQTVIPPPPSDRSACKSGTGNPLSPTGACQ
jgi:hypothetical protein